MSGEVVAGVAGVAGVADVADVVDVVGVVDTGVATVSLRIDAISVPKLSR